jgi:hypothetical protein
LAYQPPASSTFLSEQTSHQQSANSTFLSQQTSISQQPNEHAHGRARRRAVNSRLSCCPIVSSEQCTLVRKRTTQCALEPRRFSWIHTVTKKKINPCRKGHWCPGVRRTVLVVRRATAQTHHHLVAEPQVPSRRRRLQNRGKRPAFPPSRRAVCRVPGAGVIVAPRTCTTDALETAAVGRTDTAESPPCMASGTTVPFQHSGSPFQLTPYCHTYAASHYVTFRREAFIYGEGLLLTWRFSFKLQAAAGSRPPPPSPVVVTDRLVFCCLL